MKLKSYFPVYLLTLFLLTSCLSNKKVSYFQGIKDGETNKIEKQYEYRIQPLDFLSIHVTSLSKEASSFFNSVSYSNPLDERPVTTGNEDAYIVDKNGVIELPLVGKIKISGLNIADARDTIKNRLSKYLEQPAVFIRCKNFKVTVIGEVARPGVFYITNEKVSLPEAIGLAGDLTIYAKRQNILIIREQNGMIKKGFVDLTSKQIFDSEFYYLQPNDVVYIDPGKGKVAAADNFYRIFPIIISSLTLLTVVLAQVIK